MRVALFITCFNDTLFPETGRAVVDLLERLGHEVEFPEEQTCCGQMHWNTGYAQEALPLVRRFVHVFADAETIVSPSGSCVSMVREHYPRAAQLAGDDGLAAEVAALAPRVFELSELLTGLLGLEDVGASFTHRVTFPVRVTEFTTGRSMTWTGGMPLGLFKGVRTYRLTPQGEGTTRFDMREEYTGPLLPMIWRSMPDLQPSFDKFANGLKAKAESAG